MAVCLDQSNTAWGHFSRGIFGVYTFTSSLPYSIFSSPELAEIWTRILGADLIDSQTGLKHTPKQKLCIKWETNGTVKYIYGVHGLLIIEKSS